MKTVWSRTKVKRAANNTSQRQLKICLTKTTRTHRQAIYAVPNANKNVFYVPTTAFHRKDHKFKRNLWCVRLCVSLAQTHGQAVVRRAGKLECSTAFFGSGSWQQCLSIFHLFNCEICSHIWHSYKQMEYLHVCVCVCNTLCMFLRLFATQPVEQNSLK